MAFYFLTGVMGSGKSYFGTELCLKTLKEGGTVHTNLPLRMDTMEELGYLDRIVILPNDLRSLVRSVPGVVDPKTGIMGKATMESDLLVAGREGAENTVVIDEASLEFDIDDQKSNAKDNKPLFHLVALCRHVGLDLYFLAQHQQNVDVRLRRMCEFRIKCVKTERLPFVGWLLAILPTHGTFLRIYYQGQSNSKTGVTWHKFDKQVGDAYDTHGMRGGIKLKQGAARVRAPEATNSKGKRWGVLIVCAICSLIYFAVSRGTAVYEEIKKPAVVPDYGAPKGSGAAAAIGAPAEAGSTGKPGKATKQKRSWGPEWDLSDEWAYQAVVRSRDPVKVFLRGGDVLSIGKVYQGETIERCVELGGWFYFRTDEERWVVARPFTSHERHEIWQASLNKNAPPTVKEQLLGAE